MTAVTRQVVEILSQPCYVAGRLTAIRSCAIRIFDEEWNAPTYQIHPLLARARKPSEIRKEIAAGMIAVGKEQGEIAKKLGVTTGTVKEWRADPKVKQMVEQRLQMMLAEAGVVAKEVIGTLAMQMRLACWTS